MLAAPDAGHDHMQVVDSLRVHFRQHAGEKIGLFLVIALQYDAVARCQQMFQRIDQLVGGDNLTGDVRGGQSPLLSVRRRFQTRPGVCSAFIINLLIRQIVLIVLVWKLVCDAPGSASIKPAKGLLA